MDSLHRPPLARERLSKGGHCRSHRSKSVVPSPLTVHAENRRQVNRDALELTRHREVVAAERRGEEGGGPVGGREKENAKNKMWSNSPDVPACVGDLKKMEQTIEQE